MRHKEAPVYFRNCYEILHNMAMAGHAKPPKRNKKGKIVEPGSVSDDMRDFIAALNSGDEEKIKYHKLKNLSYLKIEQGDA